MNPVALARRYPVRAYGLLLVCLFAVGIAGHLLEPLRPFMLGITPWFLLATGAGGLLLAIPTERRAVFWLWVLAASVITLGLEILGVHTGAVFGQYRYGATLGWGVAGVPLIIGCNWVLVILAFAGLFSRATRLRWLGGIAAAGLAVAFDVVLEPLAMRLDYWQWAGGVIPLQNYLAWFLIALVFSWSWMALRLQLANRALLVLALLQAAFFAALRLGLGV